MIHRIHSDLASFRELRLRPGLNVLAADRGEGSTAKHAWDGAGKTSIVQLIHFLLGERIARDSIFQLDELAPWSFGLDFKLGGAKVRVRRSGTTRGKLSVAYTDDPTRSSLDAPNIRSTENTISDNDWNDLLGNKMFGFSREQVEVNNRLAPTFRSIFPYFVRRHDFGGFVSHIAHSSKQPPWNQQVAISYLLGLDWSVPQRFEDLRKRTRTIKTLKMSGGQGTLPSAKGSAASLRSQVAVAESKAHRLKQQLDSFNVVPEYRRIEREASELTREMNRQANENTADLQLLDNLQESLEGERPPDVSDLESLYDEASILFPERITRRFDEAVEFRRVVIENRKAHLQSEIQRIEQQIEERNNAKEVMGERRARLMEILDRGGARRHDPLRAGETVASG